MTSGVNRVAERVREATLAAVLLLAGCQLTPAPGLVACPLPPAEQVREILKIAPVGTDRETAIQALQQAGFAGAFGANQSLYYCDIWDRGEGIRWHLNVLLFFDDDGKLYATRPDAEGNVDPTPRTSQAAEHSTVRTPYDPFEQ